ncbi:hypothetical protein AMTRI_Chr02g220790 [Amborella trichopoda]|uniref:SKP1-like protein 1B n=1 Tax=Amborella trichopoda TaxID=13333 RepID=UPI0005D36D1B|nr:SKP1-like protein 1B [Amborella trichopoda]|eukprot:XP_011622217.1 SKP1-like protein 1B [Amborella trichopoda]
MNEEKKVILRSSEAKAFEVDECVAMESRMIKGIIEEGITEFGIPLPKISSKILAMIIDYCKFHVESKMKLRSLTMDASEKKLEKFSDEMAEMEGTRKKRKVQIDKEEMRQKFAVDRAKKLQKSRAQRALKAINVWDSKFVNVDTDTLYDLIVAANFLDIPDLMDLACQTAANMIKGKTPEEIRKTFNIENDFTAEEEEAMRDDREGLFD